MKKEKDLLDGAFFHVMLVLAVLFLILTITSCNKEVTPKTEPELVLPNLSMSLQVGTGKGLISTKDVNGYWHVPIVSSANNNYFSIFVEGTSIKDPEKYPGLGYALTQSEFISDAFWTISGSVRVILPTASRFGRGIYNGTRNIQPIVNGTYTITTYNFTGMEVFIVPSSGIYLKEYNSRIDQYRPSGNNLWSNRICGPILGAMAGDTITVYGKTFWALEGISNINADKVTRYDSVNIIFN